MSEFESYKRAMDTLHAPDALYTEVWNMTINKERKTPGGYRRTVLGLAAAIVLLVALGLTASAVAPGIFGWGGNFEVRREEGETSSILYTDSLTEPVRFEDGRMIFIVNGEEIDITDQVSETGAFTYSYTDEEGVTHHWLVGKNGPAPTNYGYGEFLWSEEGGWLGGYSARTNLDADGKGAPWLEHGKLELGIPW